MTPLRVAEFFIKNGNTLMCRGGGDNKVIVCITSKNLKEPQRHLCDYIIIIEKSQRVSEYTLRCEYQ